MAFTATGISLNVEQTKATTDNNWQGVDQVAIQVDGAVKPYDVEASGDYTTATLSSDKDPFYWQSTDPIEVSTWWPYAGTMPDVVVQADQSTKDNFNKSDYISATNTIEFDGPHALTFAHRTAKVVINPLKNGEGVGVDELKGATVTLTGVALTEGGEATATVIPYYDAATGTWTALLPTQTPTAGEPFILISMAGSTYSYSPDAAVTLTGGNQYTYTLTVKRPKVEGTTSISTWGPTTPVEGEAELLDHTYDEDTKTYYVYTAAGLDVWAADVRGGNTNANCTLANDIDYGGGEWSGFDYSGTFDGGGHTLSNMAILGSSHSGLIKDLSGTVQNLVLDNVSLQAGGDYTGLIAGQNYGTIAGCTVLSTCKVTVNIRAGYVGGITGYNANQVTRCHAECSLEGSSEYGYHGGIAGMNTNNGSITASSYKGSFGISGQYPDNGSLIGNLLSGSVTACWTSVTLVAPVTMEGMVGNNPDNISLTACYWEGDGITDNGTGTQVTGGNWTEAINDMNTEFGADFGWHYVAGGDGLPVLVKTE